MQSVLQALKRVAPSVTYSNGSNVHEAAAAAASAQVAVVVVGGTSCEGTDRPSTELPHEQRAYLRAVTVAQPNTVVTLMAPGAVAMGEWAASVPAITCFFLPGQAQGKAVANVLYGDVSPSGRLPITMPNVENEMGFTRGMYPGIAYADGLQTAYSEKLAVGYRWYHVHDVAPAYCFGHGLTYSAWSYSALRVNQTAVRFTLTNSGDVPASEVSQMYVTFPEAAGEPPRQLRGFQKVFLQPSQSTEITLPISPRGLSIWDAQRHMWAAVAGVFELAVGASSCDLRLRATLAV